MMFNAGFKLTGDFKDTWTREFETMPMESDLLLEVREHACLLPSNIECMITAIHDNGEIDGQVVADGFREIGTFHIAPVRGER